jgi:hypothetical protein
VAASVPVSASALQRRVLVAGAAFDAAFALPMLIAPGPAARLLRLDLPDDMTWFRLTGVLLLIVAGAYAAAARAGGPVAHHVACVAAGGRTLGAAVLVNAGWAPLVPALLAAGLADGALALAHAAIAAADARRR